MHRFGPQDGTSEPVFVPRSSAAAEGDGYLMSVVYLAEEKRSDLVILDTQAIEGTSVAIAKLTHRIPSGFHGNWKPAM